MIISGWRKSSPMNHAAAVGRCENHTLLGKSGCVRKGSLCKVANYVKLACWLEQFRELEPTASLHSSRASRSARSASGGRQMTVEKRRDLVFIEGLDLESAPVHPAPEVGRAPEIGRSGLTCVVALTKVACQGVNAGCQPGATQLAHRSAGQSP